MTRRRCAGPPRLGRGAPDTERPGILDLRGGDEGTRTPATTRRYLALALPALPVERLRHPRPVMVWQAIGGRRVVVAATGIAGVRAGQALADAQAIAPGTEAVEANPAADAAFLEGLALWALRFSPLVGVAGADALMLDISGATHLFGGEAALLARAVQGLARQGVTAQGVVAGAPGTALALARAGVSGLVVAPGGEAAVAEDLGLSALPVAPDIVAALSRMGLRRVGELRRQPRGPLARRFGTALLRALDEVSGELIAPISPIRPPPAFEAARELLEPLITREAIEATLAGLLRLLCGRLEAAGHGARRIVLRAHRVDGAVQEVVVGTGLAARDPAHLGRLFAEKLDRLEPGFGFDHLALGAEVTEEMRGTQGGFAGGALRREELARLFDRLGQRVQLWRLAPAASHWPEREATRVPATAGVEIPPGWPRAPRPVRLLRRPLEIGAMALLPDAPPSLLRIGKVAHRVRAAEGPERLEPEWWRDRPDRLARDYYRVELASGARLWVCRVGFGAEARWFLHGHL